MAVAPRHGRGTAFSLDSTAGTLVNLSSGLTEVSLSRDLDTAEITSFGDNDKSYIPGLRGATISLSGMFSSTHAEVLDGIFGVNSTATRSWEWNPDGSTAASRHLLKGEAFPTSLEYGSSVDDKVSLSCELIVSGAVTSTNN